MPMEPTSSGYRPATHRSIDMGAQRIPRRVLQTGLSFVKSNASHHGLMQNWWMMNAEYTYSFFSDARALQFVEQHGTHNGCTKVMWAERAGGWRALPVGEVFGSKVRPRRRSRSRRSHRRGRRRRTGRAANSVQKDTTGLAGKCQRPMFLATQHRCFDGSSDVRGNAREGQAAPSWRPCLRRPTAGSLVHPGRSNTRRSAKTSVAVRLSAWRTVLTSVWCRVGWPAGVHTWCTIGLELWA